jgi:ankyrin repeat protein
MTRTFLADSTQLWLLILLRSPLNNAFLLGNPAIVRTLLANGADLEYKNARTWTSLSFLWDPERPPLEDRNIAEILDICNSNKFSAWSDPDFIGWTPAHRAAAYGSGNDIRNLRYKGADLHACTTECRWPPVTIAIWRGNESTFDEFVKDVPNDLRDTRGWTMLHFAAQNGSRHILEALLNRGVDRDALTVPTDVWIMEGLDLEGRKLKAQTIARAYGHGDVWDRVVQEIDSG